MDDIYDSQHGLVAIIQLLGAVDATCTATHEESHINHLQTVQYA